MKQIKKVKRCRICKSRDLYKFLDLGEMPIPNGFLREEDFPKQEKYFPLACLFCRNCNLVQLADVVNPDIMFKDYVYIPSGSKLLMNNFYNLACDAYKKLNLSKSSLVFDIGSNDGSLLSFFKGLGTRVLGVDPALNLAKVAKERGIPTEVGLFSRTLAKKIVSKHGQADLITATNVVAHIDDLENLLDGIRLLLKDQGLFICEVHYLLDLITKNEFDTIYHEHLSYFSLKPWKVLVEKHGFEIDEVRRINIHGGSLRLTLRKKSGGTHCKTVKYLITLEERSGLYTEDTYRQFAGRILALKTELKSLLVNLRAKGKKIVGLGAPAKANVITNFFDIDPQVLDYIADATLYKQGRYTPGKHIPIYPEERIFADLPDYSVIFTWNFANEIIQKYRKTGTKFIIPIPEVKIV